MGWARERGASKAYTPRIHGVFSGMAPVRARSLCPGTQVAEREGFEPSVPLPVRLISNQVRSTKLRHLSAAGETSILIPERDASGARYSEGPRSARVFADSRTAGRNQFAIHPIAGENFWRETI